MQKPKGTLDYFGQELTVLRGIEGILRKIFSKHNYQEVETPAFEYFELFEKKSGKTVLNQLYTFKEKSGRLLVLRPELTAPTIRFYLTHLKSLPKPVKLCYIGDCFRYEEPQAYRWRQFKQAGVEILGSNRPEADIEILVLTSEIMKEIGVSNVDLRVGDVGILREVLKSARVSESFHDPILRAIDRKDDSRLSEELSRANMDKKTKEMLQALVGLRGSSSVLQEAAELLTSVSSAVLKLENLNKILTALDELNIRYTIDFGIARGLEYYTGTVFETYVDRVQVAGGGRYDNLVEILGGPSCPAVGVGIGITRLAKMLVGKEKKEDKLDCFIIPTSPDLFNVSMGVAQDLRKIGLRVEVEIMNRKLSKALTSANAKNAERVIIIGPKDWSEGKITVRNMDSGEQLRISHSELLKWFKNKK